MIDRDSSLDLRPSDVAIDLRLRHCGERWRAEVPLTAVPSTPPPSRRRRWPVAVAAASAGAVVAMVVAAITLGPDTGGTDPADRSGPSAPTSATAPVAPFMANATPYRRCTSGDLHTGTGRLSVAGGTKSLRLQLMLTHGAPCLISGYPTVTLLSHHTSSGLDTSRLSDDSAEGTVRPVVVSQGHPAVLTVLLNGAPCPAVDNDRIQATLPEGGTTLHLPGFGRLDCTRETSPAKVVVAPMSGGDPALLSDLSGDVVLVGGPPPGSPQRVLRYRLTATSHQGSWTVHAPLGGSWELRVPPGRYRVAVISPLYHAGREACIGNTVAWRGTASTGIRIVCPVR